MSQFDRINVDWTVCGVLETHHFIYLTHLLFRNLCCWRLLPIYATSSLWVLTNQTFRNWRCSRVEHVWGALYKCTQKPLSRLTYLSLLWIYKGLINSFGKTIWQAIYGQFIFYWYQCCPLLRVDPLPARRFIYLFLIVGWLLPATAFSHPSTLNNRHFLTVWVG